MVDVVNFQKTAAQTCSNVPNRAGGKAGTTHRVSDGSAGTYAESTTMYVQIGPFFTMLPTIHAHTQQSSKDSAHFCTSLVYTYGR